MNLDAFHNGLRHGLKPEAMIYNLLQEAVTLLRCIERNARPPGALAPNEIDLTGLVGDCNTCGEWGAHCVGDDWFCEKHYGADQTKQQT